MDRPTCRIDPTDKSDNLRFSLSRLECATKGITRRGKKGGDSVVKLFEIVVLGAWCVTGTNLDAFSQCDATGPG